MKNAVISPDRGSRCMLRFFVFICYVRQTTTWPRLSIPFSKTKGRKGSISLLGKYPVFLLSLRYNIVNWHIYSKHETLKQMLIEWWATVCDAGPPFNQHREDSHNLSLWIVYLHKFGTESIVNKNKVLMNDTAHRNQDIPCFSFVMCHLYILQKIEKNRTWAPKTRL